jgi:hypothetical protein
VAGIRTGTLDYPCAGGAPGCRVALVNTGSPLRFTVALDRGGDIVEAFFNQHSLVYLTPNGYKPPSPAYLTGTEFLASWPGGLLTSCGPQYIGSPRLEDGVQTAQHGHHSNTPAALDALVNPDPAAGRRDMLLAMTIADTRMFGPVVTVQRQVQCTVGVPEVHVADTITNRGDMPVAHNWLYHCNFGYPLLDRGSRLVFAGRRTGAWDTVPAAAASPGQRRPEAFKLVPDPLPEHTGSNERGVLLDPRADARGLCHAGLINPKLDLGVELEFPRACLPRLAVWQHYGPAGSYVCGLEPFTGSLLGKAADHHRLAGQMLAPGASHTYRLTLRVLTGRRDLDRLRRHDGPLVP